MAFSKELFKCTNSYIASKKIPTLVLLYVVNVLESVVGRINPEKNPEKRESIPTGSCAPTEKSL